jgi:hypothetical protein
MFKCLILLLCLINTDYTVYGEYPYSLPGDANWPTLDQFLELKYNKSITGKVALRSEAGYYPHTWNRRTNVPKPAVIVQPNNPQDIITSLKFANQFNLRISVQSTGHHQDIRNIYDNSVHIDMSTMNSKSIDIPNRRLTLGPGNNFSQIHKYVSQQTNNALVALSGADPGVGIYGWTVGGGHGALTRLYGLGVDALLSIDLLLANYTIITASETQNEDLFRSLRGSGGSAYGIGLSLTVKLFDTPGPMSMFNGVYALDNKTAELFGNWMINAPNNVFAYFLPTNFGNPNVFITAECYGNQSYCSPILNYLKTNCTPVIGVTNCEPQYEKFKTFYDYIFSAVSDLGTSSVSFTSTALNSSNIIPALKDTVTYLSQNIMTGCSGNAVLGGVSSTIDLNQITTSVALAMRQSSMALTCYSVIGYDDSVSTRKHQVNVMDNFGENILKKHNKWVYWNEPQHNFPASSNDWKDRYWGGLDNYNKLLAVKQKYDPNNTFTCYHCIGYVGETNIVPSVCPQDSCTCTNTPSGGCASIPNILNNDKIISFNIYLLLSSLIIILVR